MTVTLDAENGPEVWREASGFPNYLISNYGRIYSKPRTIARKGSAPVYTDRNRDSTAAHTIARDGRFMNPSLSKGYPRVTLRRDGQTHYVFVHQLMMLTFIGAVPEGQEVRHRNDSRADCRLSNLEYGTRAQNIADCKKNGGFRNGAAHLTDALVLEIYNRPLSETGASLAAEFGVHVSTISVIRNGKAWKHLGLPERKMVRTGDNHPARRGAENIRRNPTAPLNPEPVIGRTPDRTAGIVDPDKV
jgi:hypothetical protein